MPIFILFLFSEPLGVGLKKREKIKWKVKKVASLPAIKLPQQLQLCQPQVTNKQVEVLYPMVIL